MLCPVCSHPDTRVVDSRVTGDGYCIRRRRECARCDYRFSTNEEVELLELMLVKSDGKREPYLRDKLIGGLKKALEKRPYTTDGFKRLVTAIERDIQKKKDPELTSREVGEIVMRHLQKFDAVAYVRFASVYRSFEDVETFGEEISKLMSSGTKAKKVRSKAAKRR